MTGWEGWLAAAPVDAIGGFSIKPEERGQATLPNLSL
jgi:hypothetical protein